MTLGQGLSSYFESVLSAFNSNISSLPTAGRCRIRAASGAACEFFKRS
jgi:hypothetical protein